MVEGHSTHLCVYMRCPSNTAHACILHMHILAVSSPVCPCRGRSRWLLAWQVVDVAAIHEEMPILGVTQRRQVARELSCWHARIATGSSAQRDTDTDTHRHTQTHSEAWPAPWARLTWHVVDEAPIHQQVPVLGSQSGAGRGSRRHWPGRAPHAACRDGG